jgi:hypothetical protein|nr:MAG TPA: Protein of unknown function (DUF1351) [Caudoviricetes sp.]
MESLIKKPQFKGEIKAQIKSVGEIESNMKEVKRYVENLNNYYKNITFTEETMKDAKDEKSKVNKFKSQVADYRKNIIAEYNKPIKAFEDTAKETEKLLAETYNTINQQVANYENKQKEIKEQEIKEYFEECKIANNIDFITYGQAKIDVTLSASMKNLKEQAKSFIDKVADDLKLIETQEHKTEILVEYKQTLNVSQAITSVTNRFKAIEEEKKKIEQEKELQEFVVDTAKESDKYSEQIILNAPSIEEKTEETLTLKFTVRGTRTKLKELKQFLESGGYDYE